MKDIPGFENLYAATEDGKIWSYYTKKFLQPSIGKNNYLKVTLTKNGIKYTKSIHRLIAETFIPNPTNLPLVNHKDENKTNNTIENLEWCTYLYNSNYGNHPQQQAERMKKFRLENPDFGRGENNHKSIQIKCLETGETFETFSAAAKWCNLKSTVCFTDYFNGRQSSAGKHPITNEKLHWQKYENNKWINALPYQSKKRENKALQHKVRCVETNEIFNSITDAQNHYAIKHVGECCSGTRKTAGGKHWEYIKELE